MKICSKCKLNQVTKQKSYCEDCFRDYHKRWYEKNKDREKKKSKEYSRWYRKKFPEKCLQYQKKYPKYKEILKRWRLKNKDKIRKYQKDYLEKHKEKKAIWDFAKNKLREEIIKERKCCEDCKSILDLQLHHTLYTNDKEKIKLLCRDCHRKEHKKKKS